MSLLEIVVALPGAEADVLPFPPFVFAAIAATVFLVLGFVMWSFRDAANRHSHKSTGSAHDAGHTTDHH